MRPAGIHSWIKQLGNEVTTGASTDGRPRIPAYLRVQVIVKLSLCVPKTSSRSCDQAILVDQATDASVSSDAVLVEIDRFG